MALLIVMLMWNPLAAQSGGSFNLEWSTAEGGGSSAAGPFDITGVAGQSDAGRLSGGPFVVEGGFLVVEQATTACEIANDCGDMNADGIRDDGCIWNECDAGACASQDIVFADMGGAFGACLPDTFANIHDRNHALNCFAGVNTCSAINIDAGGAFGACAPDGFCNIHDANHSMTAFAGTNSCGCPAGPAPEWPAVIVGEAMFAMEPTIANVRPGDEVSIRVMVRSEVEPQAYQLEVVVNGGRRGRVELVAIEIEPLRDWIFAGAGEAFDAFNVDRGQMLCGLSDPARDGNVSGYLATYRYRATADASGTFEVMVHGASDSQTFLVGVDSAMIDIIGSEIAVISVHPAVKNHGK
jgi:hypothetical protein